eukprot:3544498-Pleurochrysis_carterae.AAC.5
MGKSINVNANGAQNGAERGVAVEETREVLPHEELLGWSRLEFSAQDIVRRRVEPIAGLPLRRGQVGRGRGKQQRSVYRTVGGTEAQKALKGSLVALGNRGEGGTGSSELLCGPVVLQVMQERKEGRTRSSEASRADTKVRSTNQATGRGGTATMKTVVLTSARVSSSTELRTAVKVERCPRTRWRARGKSCSLE